MRGKQLSIQLRPELRERLILAAKEGDLSIGEVIRRALERYLNPPPSLADQLIAALRDPITWPAIYHTLQSQIAATVAAQPPPPAPPPPEPRSTWIYQRPAGAPVRTPPPTAPVDDDIPPF